MIGITKYEVIKCVVKFPGNVMELQKVIGGRNALHRYDSYTGAQANQRTNHYYVCKKRRMTRSNLLQYFAVYLWF